MTGAYVELGCACATARRTARVVTQLYDRYLRECDIEGTQFGLLSVVQATGGCSQASIGRALALDKTTLSRNLQLLKRKGWVKASAAEDGRERRFVLTSIGRDRLEAAKPAWRRAQQRLRSRMSDRDWKAMWRSFQAVTVAAQEGEER